MSQTAPWPFAVRLQQSPTVRRQIDVRPALPGRQARADLRPAGDVPERGDGLEARDGEEPAVGAELERQHAGAAMIELADELPGGTSQTRTAGPDRRGEVPPSGLKATASSISPESGSTRRWRAATPSTSQISALPVCERTNATSGPVGLKATSPEGLLRRGRRVGPGRDVPELDADRAPAVASIVPSALMLDADAQAPARRGTDRGERSRRDVPERHRAASRHGRQRLARPG